MKDMLSTETSLTFTQRWGKARRASCGDVWVHRKTGKKVTVLGRVGYSSVKLRHESGRMTFKGDGYLASDYTPETI